MSSDALKISGMLVIVGGGKMGEALIVGLLKAGTFDASSITVVEPVSQRCTALAAAHGVCCVADGAKAIDDADIVLFALKPQMIDTVVASFAALLGSKLVVSIAAGISSARLESLLPEGTAVVRVMPNTPAMVGSAMSVISGGAEATAEQVDLIRKMFASVGAVLVIDERYQDVATAISGSGPAYVALFIDALARAGVAQGLSRDVAQELAIETVRGTADLLDKTGMHPEQLIDGVSSPGGTTIAAIQMLEAQGVRAAIDMAVATAVERAKELGS